MNKIVEVRLEQAKEQNIKITIIDKNLIKPYINYVNEKYSVNIEKDYQKFYDLSVA